MKTAISQNKKYIKSFSKGQITVPKEFRDILGLGDVFWLKLYIAQNKIIAEPAQETNSSKEYAQKILDIKGTWFSVKDWKGVRRDVEKRLRA